MLNIAVNDKLSNPSLSSSDENWPTLHPAALHGLAGDVVRLITPHSEADPVALLIQTLVVFGNVIGRTAHFSVEERKHFLNLFAVLVGDTAKGRKGTSFGRIESLVKDIDEGWRSKCVHKGLSSGEGLIWAVRDPIEKLEPIKDNKRITDYQNVIVDPGVEDKRLLVIEEEFASILKVISREGNTLSPLIRQAWDDGRLQVMTKNSPATATDAHVSVIGHITKSELNRYLSSTESGNGFANRFLWACVKRSKYLPEGGRPLEGEFESLKAVLGGAVEFARGVREMRRDESATTLWHEVYIRLSQGHPGLLGAITNRAEAQVMRLACLYALLDRSTEIQRTHLESALAIWHYCLSSARYVFGGSLGDPIAEEILRALRASEDGSTRTEIINLFGNNKRKPQIDGALQTLHVAGLVELIQPKSGEKGRPEERWRAIPPAIPHENEFSSFSSFLSYVSETETDPQTETPEEVND